MSRRSGYPLLRAPDNGYGLGGVSVERQHLAALAFFAALARARGLALESADAIYLAGYEAKRQQLGRHPNPYEREKLRAAAERIWKALNPTTVEAPNAALTTTTRALPWATASR